MSNIMATVDQRTQLAGKNRMELLLFRLDGKQLYGINVFKVKEATRFPVMTVFPQRHPSIIGVTQVRGMAMPIIDLNRVINKQYIKDHNEAFIIISEYNMHTQAIAVCAVEKIINIGWNDIHPPPIGSRSAGGSYLTAITRFNNEIIEILDVEKIIDEIVPHRTELSQNVLNEDKVHAVEHTEVLVVDDSAIARSQIKNVIQQVGPETITCSNGQQAYDLLIRWIDQGENVPDKLLLIISDIEMPEMDGYTLTSKIKAHPGLKDCYVILHTSLTGDFNQPLIEKVGADQFISKFEPDVLAKAVKDRLRVWANSDKRRLSQLDEIIRHFQEK